MSDTILLAGSGYQRSKVPVPVTGASNIDVPGLAAVFACCAALYLVIYALEAPVRYGLYLAGKDSFILLRDGLMAVPLILLCAAQANQLRLHPAFLAFGVAMAFHGLVLMGTVGSVTGAAYGVKVVMNLLFGFFVAGMLIAPQGRMLRLFAVLWVLIMIGIILDKWGLPFPWTGMTTQVGDLNVDVSKDWQISDPFARRVAGFTRSSIAVAAILPCLAIVLMCRMRSLRWRMALALPSVIGVFLTTQKGSLIAFVPIAFLLCLPSVLRLGWLRICFLGFLLLAAGLPLFTHGLHLDHGDGVFSMESLFLRIAYTWPDAWDWIARNQMLVFGVGLGGIGGPQRLYAPSAFNPADNIAVLLYAYFGLFAVLYAAMTAWLAFKPVASGKIRRAEASVAILAFAAGYGVVLSVIEDQAACLFLGAAVGTLWRETIITRPEEPQAIPSQMEVPDDREQQQRSATRNRQLRPGRI
ncbi:hypothetical protein [Niveispirillum sp. KHB5.9]|uniref:hypothetical protein n=1 Tax=Niveispirillum sp. KHB5.9 TaxID=3400269 RepID=UPI003A883B9E